MHFYIYIQIQIQGKNIGELRDVERTLKAKMASSKDEVCVRIYNFVYCICMHTYAYSHACVLYNVDMSSAL